MVCDDLYITVTCKVPKFSSISCEKLLAHNANVLTKTLYLNTSVCISKHHPAKDPGGLDSTPVLSPSF